jgi:hypothetical protein
MCKLPSTYFNFCLQTRRRAYVISLVDQIIKSLFDRYPRTVFSDSFFPLANNANQIK